MKLKEIHEPPATAELLVTEETLGNQRDLRDNGAVIACENVDDGWEAARLL